MANWAGQLNSNEIFSSIFNMIISQQVFADNIGKHQTLVDKARVDGGLFGDTKLYYSTDVLTSYVWGAGGIAGSNILAEFRPGDPNCQAITLNKFRQIPVTVDSYLSKRAWSTEGAFAEFNSVILGWLRETKRVYDGTLYNVFIGTDETSVGKQSQTWTLTTVNSATPSEAQAQARTRAMEIAQKMADLLVDMGDYGRNYNDNQFLRSYDAGRLKVVWNAKYVNEIKKVDVPTIFNNAGLVDKLDEEVLPERYFGTLIDDATKLAAISASTPAAGYPIDSDDGAYTPGVNNANGKVCSAIENTVTVGGTDYHVFPGDELPAGATVGASKQFGIGEIFVPNAKVIAKVMAEYPPYMSAFEVGTSFYNPMTLAENHYLTFGHNTLAHLKEYPMVTIKEA